MKKLTIYEAIFYQSQDNDGLYEESAATVRGNILSFFLNHEILSSSCRVDAWLNDDSSDKEFWGFYIIYQKKIIIFALKVMKIFLEMAMLSTLFAC